MKIDYNSLHTAINPEKWEHYLVARRNKIGSKDIERTVTFIKAYERYIRGEIDKYHPLLSLYQTFYPFVQGRMISKFSELDMEYKAKAKKIADEMLNYTTLENLFRMQEKEVLKMLKDGEPTPEEDLARKWLKKKGREDQIKPKKRVLEIDIYNNVLIKTKLDKLNPFDMHCLSSMLRELWLNGTKFSRWQNDMERKRLLKEESERKPLIVSYQ